MKNEQEKLAEKELGLVTGGQQSMPPLSPDPPISHSLCPVCKVNYGTPGFVPCASCAKIIGWSDEPSYYTDGVFHPGSM